MKVYYVQYNIGNAKYVVCFHHGEKHKDGSPFFHARIFNDKAKMESFVNELKSLGYTE